MVNLISLVKQVISWVSLIKIGPFVFEIFSFEICQYFGFLIFQNAAIQAKRKLLNLIFLVKQVISKVQAKFNVRPLWGNLVKKLIENAFKHLHLAIFYS
jgi:hypothetical protein